MTKPWNQRAPECQVLIRNVRHPSTVISLPDIFHAIDNGDTWSVRTVPKPFSTVLTLLVKKSHAPLGTIMSFHAEISRPRHSRSLKEEGRKTMGPREVYVGFGRTDWHS